MPRPKGSRFFPKSVAMTMEQRDWCDRQPNYSAEIRGFIDGRVASEREQASIGEESIVSLFATHDALVRRKVQLTEQRATLEDKKGVWETGGEGKLVKGEDGYPVPKATEAAKLARARLQGISEEMAKVDADLKKAKDAIFARTHQ